MSINAIAPAAGASAALSLEEFARVNDRRASAYAFLSRLFIREVDQDLLDEMHAMRFPAKSGSDHADEGARLITGYLSNVWEDSLRELAIDYVHTFIGSGMDAFSAAYPYESVYTSPRRLMMQEARDEVLAIYRSEGLDKAVSWKESEDHIAAECSFMSILATRSAEALRAGDEGAAARLLRVQRSFLEDHLHAWAGMMTADMRAFARTDFYRGLASYADGVLEADLELLAGVLGPEGSELEGA